MFLINLFVCVVSSLKVSLLVDSFESMKVYREKKKLKCINLSKFDLFYIVIHGSTVEEFFF